MAASAKADNIGFGVRGGLPFGDAFESATSRNFEVRGRNRFVIGPTLELRLPAGLGASFDILYRRYGFDTISNGNTSTQSAAQWEFPLMMRYRFPGIVARPFIAGGPVWSKLTGITSTRNTTGIALGAGVDISIPLFHITPELRYQRRLQDTIATGATGIGVRSNSNQVDLMVGFTF
jgi:hypothetical protein